MSQLFKQISCKSNSNVYAFSIKSFGSLTLAIKEKRCEASKMAYFFVNFSIFFLSNV